MIQSGYLLGIGSNIKPAQNIVQIIALLLERFPQLSLSRVLKIPPVGMNSHHDFLNVVAFIETDLSEKSLKTICNHIEIKLGRDRNDPTRKVKDRPADLDILKPASFPNDAPPAMIEITDEYFLYPLLEEISAYLSNSHYSLEQDGETLWLDSLSFGQTATTINSQTYAGDKGVVE